MSTATTYRTVVTHSRRAPVRNRFRYRASAWLVDLDDLPRLPRGLRWLAAFEPADHLGDPTATLRRNLDAVLAAHDLADPGGRVLMLANARSMGHAFNPITIYWCLASDATVTAVVAEVHNTYGDRHAYVLRTDASGRVDQGVDKKMYVSPFNPVDGTYRITVSPPSDRISVTVTLSRPGAASFVASLTGVRRPSCSVVTAAVATAAASLRVSTLIRRQGISLYLRGLRIEPRPAHVRQTAAG